MADEAVHIGEAAATESYLRGDRILEVAESLGVGGIHPGYGFLSENAEFAELCRTSATGVKFIGLNHRPRRTQRHSDSADAGDGDGDGDGGDGRTDFQRSAVIGMSL